MICISTSGVLGSNLTLFPPLSIWFRCLFAAILLGIYCKFQGLNFQLIKGKSTRTVFINGVLMTLHWVAYFFALTYTNVAISMLAVFTYPMMTTLMEPLFFKLQLQSRSILLSFLILIGVFFLLPSFDMANSDTKGLVFGILSGFFYALRNILSKGEIDSYNGSILMFYQCVIAVLILIPVFFFTQPSFDIVVEELPYLIGLGLITTAIGHTMFLNSFGHFNISTASIMSSLQPVYGIILAIIFLSEIPSWRSVLGGAIIMICVMMESLASLKTKSIA